MLLKLVRRQTGCGEMTNMEHLSSGCISTDDQETWSSWFSCASSWPTLEEIRSTAQNMGLSFRCDSQRETGWIFKRTTYHFTVSGSRLVVWNFRVWVNKVFEELSR